MGKLLFWIAVIALIWAAVSLVRVSQRKQERAQDEDRPERRAPSPGANGRSKGGSARLEEMIACRHCGVFLPASDALQGREGRYCSVEHRDAHRR
jgi:uncharacterized protein